MGPHVPEKDGTTDEATDEDTLKIVWKVAEEGYQQAWNEERWGHALSAVTTGLYYRCVALMVHVGCETDCYGSEPVDYATALSLRDGLRALLPAKPGVEVLAECMTDLCSFLALTGGTERERDEQTHLLRLTLLAERLGRYGMHLALVESGHLSKLQTLEATVAKLASQKGRKAQWEDRFLSTAREYCVGQTRVSIGSLVRRAREWAEEERGAGRNPGLPGTDKGISLGLKRMETEGLLMIPGRF